MTSFRHLGAACLLAIMAICGITGCSSSPSGGEAAVDVPDRRTQLDWSASVRAGTESIEAVESYGADGSVPDTHYLFTAPGDMEIRPGGEDATVLGSSAGCVYLPAPSLPDGLVDLGGDPVVREIDEPRLVVPAGILAYEVVYGGWEEVANGRFVLVTPASSKVESDAEVVASIDNDTLEIELPLIDDSDTFRLTMERVGLSQVQLPASIGC